MTATPPDFKKDLELMSMCLGQLIGMFESIPCNGMSAYLAFAYSAVSAFGNLATRGGDTGPQPRTEDLLTTARDVVALNGALPKTEIWKRATTESNEISRALARLWPEIARIAEKAVTAVGENERRRQLRESILNSATD